MATACLGIAGELAKNKKRDVLTSVGNIWVLSKISLMKFT